MANIGSLFPQENGTLSGGVRTRSFKMPFWLKPFEGEKTDKTPDFIVYAKSLVDGEPCEVGTGRHKTSGRTGNGYIQLFLSDPDVPPVLQFVTAHPAGEGVYNISFSPERPREQNAEQRAA